MKTELEFYNHKSKKEAGKGKYKSLCVIKGKLHYWNHYKKRWENIEK